MTTAEQSVERSGGSTFVVMGLAGESPAGGIGSHGDSSTIRLDTLRRGQDLKPNGDPSTLTLWGSDDEG